jgi:hypothetical protein
VMTLSVLSPAFLPVLSFHPIQTLDPFHLVQIFLPNTSFPFLLSPGWGSPCILFLNLKVLLFPGLLKYS